VTDPKLKAARAFIERLFTEYDVWACETGSEQALLDQAAEICEWDRCEHCREYIWPGNGVTIQTEPTELYGRNGGYPGAWGKLCDSCAEPDYD